MKKIDPLFTEEEARSFDKNSDGLIQKEGIICVFWPNRLKKIEFLELLHLLDTRKFTNVRIIKAWEDARVEDGGKKNIFKK